MADETCEPWLDQLLLALVQSPCWSTARTEVSSIRAGSRWRGRDTLLRFLGMQLVYMDQIMGLDHMLIDHPSDSLRQIEKPEKCIRMCAVGI